MESISLSILVDSFGDFLKTSQLSGSFWLTLLVVFLKRVNFLVALFVSFLPVFTS